VLPETRTAGRPAITLTPTGWAWVTCTSNPYRHLIGADIPDWPVGDPTPSRVDPWSRDIALLVDVTDRMDLWPANATLTWVLSVG
jgi:hypothetical protein